MLREPGGCKISEKVRDILLDKENSEMFVETEAYLYFAARSQVVREVIKPAIESGKVVICDRFEDSTMVYQGFAGGLGFEKIRSIGEPARAGLEPDLTFVLDLDVETGLKRCGRGDRMERKGVDFHEKVREGFIKMAEIYPDRIRVIKVDGSIEKIREKIIKELRNVTG